MIKAIKGEIYKNISIWGIVGFVAVIIMFAFITFEKNGKISSDNWRELAEQNKAVYQQQLLSLQQQNNSSNKEVIEKINDEITRIDYCLENNCPYEVITVGTFMFNLISGNKSLIMAFIVLIGFCILLKEDSNKTWKMILTTGAQCKKIILAKLCSMAIIEGLYSVITLAIAYVAGLFKYGNNYTDYTVMVSNGVISIKNNNVVAINEMLRIFLFSIFLSMLMYLLYSVNINKNIILMGAYIITFFAYYINKLLIVLKIDRFTPIKYLYQDEVNILGMAMMVSIYSIILIILGNKLLKRGELINR